MAARGSEKGDSTAAEKRADRQRKRSAKHVNAILSNLHSLPGALAGLDSADQTKALKVVNDGVKACSDALGKTEEAPHFEF